MSHRLERRDLFRYGGGLLEDSFAALSDGELEDLGRRIDITIAWISWQRELLRGQLTPRWRYALDLLIFASGLASFLFAGLDWIANGASRLGELSLLFGVVATIWGMVEGLPQMVRQRAEVRAGLDELVVELAWAKRAGQRIAQELNRRASQLA